MRACDNKTQCNREVILALVDKLLLSGAEAEGERRPSVRVVRSELKGRVLATALVLHRHCFEY